MREIKFRQYVWDNDSKGTGRMVGWDELLSEEGESLAATFTTEFSNASPLMQYTGLKDKNGQEIYEGDILKVPVTGNEEYHGKYSFHEVVKVHGQWVLSYLYSETGRKLPRGYTRGLLLDCFEFDMKLFLWAEDYQPATETEVIGNIYDNPELLEVENHA